jgi:hypothetical protein
MDVITALARALQRGEGADDAARAYAADPAAAWRTSRDPVSMVQLAARAGAWDGVRAAVDELGRDLTTRLTAVFGALKPGNAAPIVPGWLVEMAAGLDVARRCAAAHDAASLGGVLATVPFDEGARGVREQFLASVRRRVPEAPALDAILAPAPTLRAPPEEEEEAGEDFDGDPLRLLVWAIDDGDRPRIERLLAPWGGGGRDPLGALWAASEDGGAMCDLLDRLGRPEPALSRVCDALQIEGAFRSPERYAYVQELAGALLVRMIGPAAPTQAELQAALAAQEK